MSLPEAAAGSGFIHRLDCCVAHERYAVAFCEGQRVIFIHQQNRSICLLFNGEGPFICELFGEAANALREAGGEYGAATGRPRRVGGFDAVASRYGAKMQGCDCIALTKLDELSYMEKIPVCVAYEINGRRTADFPASIDDLNAAKPVYETLPGFHCDISACRAWDELPREARDYIRFIEQAVRCPIRYVSVGAERDAIINLHQ